MGYDGYVRVSSTRGRGGDSFISPEQQRDRITAWADFRAVTIHAWHEDLDVSGGRVSRPGLDAALQRAEAGVTQGIVVAKVDRFARSLVGALELIRRLDNAGAQFVSVAEGIDPSTSNGKMMQNLMLVLAEFELDRIRDSWADARRRAVERGVHVSSAVPTGYVRGEGGVLEVDPVVAPHVRRAFEMAASGAYWRDIGAMLRDAGVSGPYGQTHWDVRAVTLLVKNPAYTGEARSGEYRNPTAHEPIVTRSLYERASRPRHIMAPRTPSTALLAGLVRCAGCQHVMKADKMTVKSGVRKGERSRIYRCRTEYAAGRCPEPASVAGWTLEPWLVDRFFMSLEPVTVTGTRRDSDRAALETLLEDAISELEEYRDQRIEDALGRDLFIDGLVKRRRTVDDLTVRIASAHSGNVQDLGTITDAWPALTVIEQRDLLAAGIDAVMIRRGRLPLDERAFVLWRGELPDSVPRRGRRLPLSRFEWPDG